MFDWAVAELPTYPVDEPDTIARSFAVIDELTSDHGVVTSELVPALSVARDSTARTGLRLARFRF